MITVVIADRHAEALAAQLPMRPDDVRLRLATNPQQLADEIESAEALVTFGMWLDASMIARAPRLRWIQALTAGTDHIVPLLAGRDITLTSAAGMHGAPVSEMTLMLMLALARRFPRLLRQQDVGQWGGPMAGQEPGSLLHGKTVGIAGVGVSGQAIAQRCKAFGMSTLGFGSTPRICADIDEFLTYALLARNAGRLDFLVIVTPLRPATENLFDATIFEAMKPTSFVINVGRGGTVNESDLLAAVTGGRIAGAALDAFRREPLPPDSPFWTCPNIVVTPHAAGSYDRYLIDVAAIVEDNIRLFADGRRHEMRNLIPLG